MNAESKFTPRDAELELAVLADAIGAMHRRLLEAGSNQTLRALEAIAPAALAAPELAAALRAIADEPCDHGPGPHCPRQRARAALDKAGVKS